MAVLAHSIKFLGRVFQDHIGFHCLVNSIELVEFLEYVPSIHGYIFCKRVVDDDNVEKKQWLSYQS